MKEVIAALQNVSSAMVQIDCNTSDGNILA